MESDRKAVVLLSGGMDSATILSIAKAEDFEIFALSFNYSQRHRIELDFAKALASSLKIKKHLVVRFDMSEIGGSALTSDIAVPKNTEALQYRSRGLGADPLSIPSTHIPVTYVPARNTIFLSFALAWAEVLGTGNIFIGANALDYSGYPDCRPEYLESFENMANLATKASVSGDIKFSIRAPLISMTKSDIIRKGIDLGVDYSLTWSCYDPQPVKAMNQKSQNILRKREVSTHERFRASYRPCGFCDSCRIRAKGFREAELADPLLSTYDDNKGA